MAQNSRITVWSLILLLTVAGSAGAFDGKRTGFCLGFGAGLGTLTYSTNTYSYDGASDDETLSGFQTTLDIGAGISDQLLILYSGHTTIYNSEGSTLWWGTPTVIVRYYFKPTLLSFYVFGGPALSVAVAWGNGGGGLGFGGLGFAAGGGYQFSRNFQVQLDVVLTSDSNRSYRTIHATMNLVGY